MLELYGSDSSLITSNDNWKDTQQAQIEASGVPPEDERESAIVATLQPGSYTAIVRGKDNTTGVALAEIYDLDSAAASNLANISTRALVQLDENVLIGGFILGGGNLSNDVILRAIGPSLAEAGIIDALQDPTLELRNSDGDLVEANDDWQDNAVDAVAIAAAGVRPRNSKESAIAASLPAGGYTVIVAGKAGHHRRGTRRDLQPSLNRASRRSRASIRRGRNACSGWSFASCRRSPVGSAALNGGRIRHFL